MCIVSNIMDGWKDSFDKKWPSFPVNPSVIDYATIEKLKQDMQDIKKELIELKKLLMAAKAFDAATGQPDCEAERKVAFLKKISEIVGLDISDVLKKTT